MQTLILILIATLSFSVACLGVFCYLLNKEISNLNKQLIDARSEYRCHQAWFKDKLLAYRDNRSNKGCNSGDNTCCKCPIFE